MVLSSTPLVVSSFPTLDDVVSDWISEPLTQIVGGVGLLLAGVLNLVGNLLSGLGLDSLLKGIVAATGLDKIYTSLGLGKWLNGGK